MTPNLRQSWLYWIGRNKQPGKIQPRVQLWHLQNNSDSYISKGRTYYANRRTIERPMRFFSTGLHRCFVRLCRADLHGVCVVVYTEHARKQSILLPHQDLCSLCRKLNRRLQLEREVLFHEFDGCSMFPVRKEGGWSLRRQQAESRLRSVSCMVIDRKSVV